MMPKNRNKVKISGVLALFQGVCTGGVFPIWAGDPPKAKEPPATHGCQTPQKAFAAAQHARTKGDWKAYFNLCDDYSVNAYTGQLVAWYAMKFVAAPEELQSQPLEEKRDFERLEKVLRKHGLTDEDCRAFLKDQPKFPELNFESAWFKRIKDKPRFNAEMIAAMHTLRDYWKEGQDIFKDARLEDLRITGDKATAKVHFSDGHKEKIEFRRVKGVWLLCYPVKEEGTYG
jgi:hypothetical protein